MARNSPGVRFPPPLLFVIGFCLGWLLHRFYPMPLFPGGGNAGAWLSGWGLIALALLQPAAAIVRSGPYRFSRNPMYVALTMLHLGLVLLTNMLWPLLLLPLALMVLQKAVIQREEHYLREAFGAPYEQYCREVRRWL